ncbi:MAG: hypothetical protein GTO17_11135 [Candidatus Aminicenantes bacterium]|nr:hypothetical protein [Candidatus Aminicenantes bacterium]
MKGILKVTSKKLIVIALVVVSGIFLFYMACIGLSCIPGLFLLPKEKTTTVDGVTTIQDAVSKCEESGLSGWELVKYAQKLTARKFTYSRRNSWESPDKAFARGLGYCIQQALALKMIYDELSIDAKVVHGRGDFSESIIHGVKEPGGNFNHAWLEVTITGESKYVCPGNVDNAPGELDFKITSKVKPYTRLMHFFTFPGAIIVNAVRDFRHTGFRKQNDLSNESVRGARSLDLMDYNNLQMEYCPCKKTECYRWGSCEICREYHYDK